MKKKSVLLGAMCCLAILLGAGSRLWAADASDDVIQMVTTLVGDKDKDVRAVGLQQVREEAKGPAATKRFAALLPTLTPAAQAGLLDALADRGDNAARPAVLELLKSPDEQVRAAALRALGALGEAADVPSLVEKLAAAAGPEKTAAQASLVRLPGAAVNAAVVAELKAAKPENRVELLGILVSRRAGDSVPAVLEAAQDADPAVRAAAVTALGQLATAEHMAGLVQLVLKTAAGPDREAVEKAVMFACNRIEDVNSRATALLAAFATLSEEDKTALLSTLGRVGGAAVLPTIEAAIANTNPPQHAAGIHALCNWPDASVAPRLMELAQTAAEPGERLLALRALIRVAALPDRQRSDAERLDLLKKALALAGRDDERILVVKRARAIRSMESLRFVLPYLDQPDFAQEACATIVELAHHTKLRDPNKAEFDPALDAVMRISKDPAVVDAARRYKKGQTL